MSKRQTPASIVVDFFTTAPVAEAQLLFGIVKGTMKRRLATAPGTPSIPHKPKRRVNAKPAAAGAPIVSPAVGEVRA